MDIRDNIRFNLETLDPNRVMVEVTLFNEMVLGILYFENPKQTWNKKPLLSKKWSKVYDKPYHYEKENHVIPNGEQELKELPTILDNDDSDTHEGD
jgi:hypothetical protein